MAIGPQLIRTIPGLVLKRLLWSLIRRREFAYETVTPQGWRISGHTRDWIQRTLYYFGMWEPNLTAWIESRLSSGGVFIDVGANVGYFTLLASRRVGPNAKVVAVEAMPAIFAHCVCMSGSCGIFRLSYQGQRIVRNAGCRLRDIPNE